MAPQECLTRAGLWREVKDRLSQPGGALSGGRQQRLCIARSLAVRPPVLLMDEPCSELDPTSTPTSTRRIEETTAELKSEVTLVIVTHNTQQAARVVDTCAFFLASQGTPGLLVEHGDTRAMFASPRDARTADHVNGRFGWAGARHGRFRNRRHNQRFGHREKPALGLLTSRSRA